MSVVSQETSRAFRRKKQCKACPWKVSTVPDEDIPGGYSVDKHKRLCHLKDDAGYLETGRIMGCHESPAEDPVACVGWLVHELGPGNNIGLRMSLMRGHIGRLETEGEQHTCIEDTLPCNKP